MCPIRNYPLGSTRCQIQCPFYNVLKHCREALKEVCARFTKYPKRERGSSVLKELKKVHEELTPEHEHLLCKIRGRKWHVAGRGVSSAWSRCSKQPGKREGLLRFGIHPITNREGNLWGL